MAAATPSGASPRSAPERHEDGWSEVWLSAGHASAASSVADSLMQGHSVVLHPGLASEAECQELLQYALMCSHKHASMCSGYSRAPPRERLHVPTCLLAPAQSICNGLLQRALAFVDAQLPALTTLISGADSLSHVYADGRFHFANGEPAVKWAALEIEFLQPPLEPTRAGPWLLRALLQPRAIESPE